MSSMSIQKYFWAGVYAYGIDQELIKLEAGIDKMSGAWKQVNSEVPDSIVEYRVWETEDGFQEEKKFTRPQEDKVMNLIREKFPELGFKSRWEEDFSNVTVTFPDFYAKEREFWEHLRQMTGVEVPAYGKCLSYFTVLIH
jgi:hypothetical protein